MNAYTLENSPFHSCPTFETFLGRLGAQMFPRFCKGAGDLHRLRAARAEDAVTYRRLAEATARLMVMQETCYDLGYFCAALAEELSERYAAGEDREEWEPFWYNNGANLVRECIEEALEDEDSRDAPQMEAWRELRDFAKALDARGNAIRHLQHAEKDTLKSQIA
jgi:hypothetical protein